VVYLPTWVRWDVMRQRPQYLLEAFAAAGHPVYFVDPRQPAPRTARNVRIVPSLDHVPAEGVILYVHFAPARRRFGDFADPVVVYDILDDLSIYEDGERGLPADMRVAASHPDVVASADVVIASSTVLAERHRSERPDLVLVENGVDPDRFGTPAARPGDLPAGEGPVAGYHGAIAAWFDFDLAVAVARRLPRWRFVFVGPVDRSVRADADRLADLPNVTMLGERRADDMPGYVQSFDVGTVWFRLDHLTEAVSPLKVFEYLAAGKPVVSTPLPACTAIPEVRTATSAGGFAIALESALAAGRDRSFVAAAREVAAGAAWQARLQPVLERLEAAGRLRVPEEPG
jgi:glycosyltransferase involved in cell wall biosynthesis